MNKNIEDYKKNGYCIIKNLLSKELLENCNNYINNYHDFDESDLVPYTTLPSLYKNIYNVDSPFLEILKNNKIIKFLKLLNIKDLSYLFPRCYSKSRWYGTAADYHQEIFFNKNYGYDITEDDVFQIFISLNDHNENNSCLRIIPKSHTLGLLEHKQFIDNKIFEKARIPNEIMDDCYNKFGIYNCNLKAGDCLIFHPLTIHGSPTNASPFDRRAFASGIVCKDIISNYDKDNKIRLAYVKKRKDFVENECIKKIQKLKDIDNY